MDMEGKVRGAWRIMETGSHKGIWGGGGDGDGDGNDV